MIERTYGIKSLATSLTSYKVYKYMCYVLLSFMDIRAFIQSIKGFMHILMEVDMWYNSWHYNTKQVYYKLQYFNIGKLSSLLPLDYVTKYAQITFLTWSFWGFRNNTTFCVWRFKSTLLHIIIMKFSFGPSTLFANGQCKWNIFVEVTVFFNKIFT